jgi:hypothetical protein
MAESVELAAPALERIFLLGEAQVSELTEVDGQIEALQREEAQS